MRDALVSENSDSENAYFSEDAEMFICLSKKYGLSTDILGKTFTDALGRTYTVVGLRPEVEKQPICIQSHKNEKVYMVSANAIKDVFPELSE